MPISESPSSANDVGAFGGSIVGSSETSLGAMALSDTLNGERRETGRKRRFAWRNRGDECVLNLMLSISA